MTPKSSRGWEHAAAAAALLGAALAVELGRAFELGTISLIFAIVLGVISGALGGICLALTWAVPSRGQPLSLPEGSRALWDQWLDGTQPPMASDDAPSLPLIEDAGDPFPQRAPVRPRVFSPHSEGSMPLDDEVGPFLVTDTPGAIHLVGAPGAGKTTALRHLASIVPPYLRVTFLDEPEPSAVAEALSRGWVVYTSNAPSNAAAPPTVPTNRLLLASWGKDEWIEYLLATDRRLCASVMERLERSKSETAVLDGIPELWRVVLDRMMADPSVSGPRSALRSEFANLLPNVETRRLIERDCFAAIARHHRDPISRDKCLRRHCSDEGLYWLIRHRPVQLLLAADHIAGGVKRKADGGALAIALPRDLVCEAAGRLAYDEESVMRLRSLVASEDRRNHPMAASLLHAAWHPSDLEAFGRLQSLLSKGDAADFDEKLMLLLGRWKPDSPAPRLAGAYLDGASWPDIDLAGSHMQGVDLNGSNLSRGCLDGAAMERAQLADSVLSGCSMQGTRFDGADLNRAHLGQVRAGRATFSSAQLVAANLCRADLNRTNFHGADLTKAQFADANLFCAHLRSAKLDGADFSRADLRRADLRSLGLAGANFTDARFEGADLSRCDLEGMWLRGPDFAAANLRHALLTGSRMPGANFRDADLRAAGLAEVDWEDADLRDADLRGAAFHLGSSRSGLVGSPIACEGSRTGFYTDDFNEQDFKSPEEIRKANLSGCGPTGRHKGIDGVDFYLVDLQRRAQLDPDQVLHFRRCGAILEARA